MNDQESKLPLPSFLKILTGNGVPVAKAMAVAGKIYKEYNTPSKLTELTDVKLNAAGVSDREDRNLVLTAIRKAGFVYKGKTVTKREAIEKNVVTSPSAGPSSSMSRIAASPSKRKRKYSSDRNEFLPDGPLDETVSFDNFEFNEVLDEHTICRKSCIINRAPIMTAWAMVVAERLGFKREEALSIASVYTELNAVSKGISLGVFDESKGKNMEASLVGSQPYVELMGRSPLYQTQKGQWRALSNGTPIFPGAAFSYISRSFKQTTPYVLGALQLLATSYPPNVLNAKGWSLYADFRPQVDGWGKRSEVKCDTILSLRRKENMIPSTGDVSAGGAASQDAQLFIKVEELSGADLAAGTGQPDKPKAKKVRTMTLDEYEAALENDTTFNNVNLDFSEVRKTDE